MSHDQSKPLAAAFICADCTTPLRAGYTCEKCGSDMADHVEVGIDPILQAIEVLEAAKNGLAWYRDCYPQAASPADDEIYAQIDAAIISLQNKVESCQDDLPPYPDGHISGPCICGGWPGGKCLKCPLREATLSDAPSVLNTNDKSYWVIGWNECIDAIRSGKC